MRPSGARPDSRLSVHSLKRIAIAATTGAARTGSALNFEAIANPAPTPVRISPRHERSCTMSTAPQIAITVKVVLAGSMAKKWESWTACAVKV